MCLALKRLNIHISFYMKIKTLKTTRMRSVYFVICGPILTQMGGNDSENSLENADMNSKVLGVLSFRKLL